MPVPIPMVTYGRIVVLKRNGQDSASFDLTDSTYLFGRAAKCDIRIQLPTISEEHCRINRNEAGQAVIENISSHGTIVNGNTLFKEDNHILQNGDIITVVERSFRYEIDGVTVETPIQGPEVKLSETLPKQKEQLTPKKISSPAKRDMNSLTPMKTATPLKTNTPIKAPTPKSDNQICEMEQHAEPTTPLKEIETHTLEEVSALEEFCVLEEVCVLEEANTLEKIDVPAKVDTPVKVSTPVKVGTPTKVASPRKANTPIKVDTPGRVDTPVKTSTPIKTNAPSKASTPTKTNTPVKANTPIQANSTPTKGMTPNKIQINHDQGIDGQSQIPMIIKANSTPTKLGSPMRTPSKPISTTPIKGETVISLVNAFVPGSANKTPRRLDSPKRELKSLGSPQKTLIVEETDQCKVTTLDTFLVISTPSKQIEISQKTPKSNMNKFNAQDTLSMTPKPSVTTTPSQVNPSKEPSESLGSLRTPPPKPHTTSSPNINLLFPPTPALAAASRLSTASEMTNNKLESSPNCSVQAQLGSIQTTPLPAIGTPRSPRYSVTSTGSPVIVDADITASPKLRRVDFYVDEQPNENFVVEETSYTMSVIDHQQDETLLEKVKFDSHTMIGQEIRNNDEPEEKIDENNEDINTERVADKLFTSITKEANDIKDPMEGMEKANVIEATNPEIEGLEQERTLETEMIDAEPVKIMENQANNNVFISEEMNENVGADRIANEEELKEGQGSLGTSSQSLGETAGEKDAEAPVNESSQESAAPSTPRRSSRLTASTHSTPVASKLTTPAKSTPKKGIVKSETPGDAIVEVEIKTTGRKSLRKTPAPKNAKVEDGVEKSETDEPNKSTRKSVRHSAATPKTIPSKKSSTRKTPSGSRSAVKKTPGTGKNKKVIEPFTQEEGEADGTSPSYRPRAARAKKSGGSVVVEGESHENSNPNVSAVTATPGKRTADEPTEELDGGRRRSLRTRTPARTTA